MPTYNYECQACGHDFEEFQSMGAPLLRKCPACAKSKLQRLIGRGGGIIFKGGGFYQTDYRSDSYRKGEKAAKDAGKTKTEGKPETADKAEKRSSNDKPGKTPKD